jgi:hypothetical protein
MWYSTTKREHGTRSFSLTTLLGLPDAYRFSWPIRSVRIHIPGFIFSSYPKLEVSSPAIRLFLLWLIGHSADTFPRVSYLKPFQRWDGDDLTPDFSGLWYQLFGGGWVCPTDTDGTEGPYARYIRWSPDSSSYTDQLPNHLSRLSGRSNKMFTTALFALTALASFTSASPIASTSKSVSDLSLEKKDSQWGTGTWYTQNGNPGNCGWYKS